MFIHSLCFSVYVCVRPAFPHYGLTALPTNNPPDLKQSRSWSLTLDVSSFHGVESMSANARLFSEGGRRSCSVACMLRSCSAGSTSWGRGQSWTCGGRWCCGHSAWPSSGKTEALFSVSSFFCLTNRLVDQDMSCWDARLCCESENLITGSWTSLVLCSSCAVCLQDTVVWVWGFPTNLFCLKQCSHVGVHS